jgi:4a-hydroxytetrahydrobiopterin dehydratase
MATDLTAKQCVACHGGMPALTPEEIARLMPQLHGWRIEDEKKLVKTYRFKDFVQAVDFVNAITPVIEAEGHHPTLTVRWGAVRVSYWTHAIDALTENDFIMAAKLDQIYGREA